MEHLVEERHIDGHRVLIVEECQDEGTGFLLIIDGVLADEAEPLDRIPSDEEIRTLMRVRRPA
ncbi:hypothetical protein [Streptomyces malaysiense]|uniref:Uncharacterized protein n=1 Tax=Streptomyces malaysiense TaxID=1428626 RepID=A0A1J4PYW4_9ACTN|nr:hypothetical protein [Streptomyces malaysiense]OIK25484.1 hypothetical protein VT52_021725 [Streptomyces malaysiense]